ncbi:hypothetical protein [Saccharothrix variisporea]|uniref:Uncharacterized protein n=1 Tax=Saccharothrix variisporea TaxID=543527 RepID=A0A495WZY7_9PSEU|nr:hypothetical protein [Saccharothrix variisporea]RKT67200.1 hypothetical protein DFJ66_0369 [Saccharothrix variisporea]
MDDSGSSSSSGDSSSSYDSGYESGYDSGPDERFDQADAYFDQNGGYDYDSQPGYYGHRPHDPYGHQGHVSHHGSSHHVHHFHHRSGRRRGMSLAGAPGWVQAFVWIGVILVVAGMGLFFLEMVSAMSSFGDTVSSPGPFGTTETYSSRRSGPDTSNVGGAFGLIFVGFVLAAIGAIGNASSRR